MPIITVQKLNDADRDADSLDDFVSGNGKKEVTTRRGKKYKTAPEVEKTLLDNGLQRGFENLEKLQAHRPVIEGSLAKDLETKKIWCWETRAPDLQPKWWDSGKSDLDLANDYTDVKFEESATNLTHAQNSKKDIAEYGLFKSNGALHVMPDRDTQLYNENRLTLFPTVDSVYQFLDDIAANFPDFVTHDVVGSVQGLDIRQYTFKAPDLEKSIASIFNDYSNVEKAPLKYFIMSGVHGDEKEAVIAWVTFFYELMHNWKNSESLTGLRNKADFVFVPILNVTGYNADTRNNYNNVDLNRNANSNWTYFSNGFAGEAPEDQYETRLAASFAKTHKDAVLFIDGHDMAQLSARQTAFWIGTSIPRTKDIALDIALNASGFIGKNFNVLNDLNDVARFTKNGNGTISQSWQYNDNLDSYLIEVGRADSNPILSIKDRRTYNFEILVETMSLLQKTYFNQRLISKPIGVEIDSGKKHLKQHQEELTHTLKVSYDFYGRDPLPTFFFLNEDNKVIVPNSDDSEDKLGTEFKKDFFTQLDQSALIYVGNDGKILLEQNEGDSQGGVNFDDLPVSEFSSEDVYLDSRFIKQIRKSYPDFYFKTSNEVISHADDVYAFYDQMLADNPDYISKELFGNDTEDFPIYSYTFTPPVKEYWGGHSKTSVEPPLFVICSGIHSEKMGIIATISFFMNLVNEWRIEQYYDKLRFACKFVVVPACNPYGIRNNIRGNINGVDLNRNFDADWEKGGSQDPNNVGYRGAAPFSEVESRLIATLPDKYPNAALFMDIHQQGEAYLFWFGTILDTTKGIVVDSLDEMITFVHKQIKPGTNLQQKMGRLAYNGEGTLARYFQNVKGKPTILIETSSNNHPMLTGQWLHARVVAEKSILTVIQKAYEKEVRQRSINLI